MKYKFLLLGIFSVTVLLVLNQEFFKRNSLKVSDIEPLEKSINANDAEMNNPGYLLKKEDSAVQINQSIPKQDIDTPLFSTKTKEAEITEDIISYPDIENSEFEPSNDQERRVVSALIRFRDRMSTISKEDLVDEQYRIKQFKEEMSKIETSDPKRETIVDESGQQWEKLSYESGEVRYWFPEANLIDEDKALEISTKITDGSDSE